MADAWSGISLSAVTSTGNLTQLYPTWVSAGLTTTTAGSLRRHPCEGQLYSIQVKPDGTNGGIIEIWDLNGDDVGANVNTATTITNAELVTAQGLNLARLIYSQNFSGTVGAATTGTGFRPFQRGLAARFVAGAGSCELNLAVDGGQRKLEICGT